jgi:hypothetical protein
VQKTSLASYQLIGKQVSTHTGVQLPGATSQSSLGSPSVVRKEEDYDDFWAENGVGAGNKGTTTAGSSSGQGSMGASNAGAAPAGSARSKGASGKDDEWENW